MQSCSTLLMCVLGLGASLSTSCGGGSGMQKDLAWPWKDQTILNLRTSILLPVSSLNLTMVCNACISVVWCFCLCSGFCIRSIDTSLGIWEKLVSRESFCKVGRGCPLRRELRLVNLPIKSCFCVSFHSAKKMCPDVVVWTWAHLKAAEDMLVWQ